MTTELRTLIDRAIAEHDRDSGRPTYPPRRQGTLPTCSCAVIQLAAYLERMDAVTPTPLETKTHGQ